MRALLLVLTFVLLVWVSFSSKENDPPLPLLAIGRTLFNESLDPYDSTNNVREYLLDPVVIRGGGSHTAYEIRISYLGSPPASYSMSLLRRPDGRPPLSAHPGGRASAQRVLLDTERVVFTLKDINELPLDSLSTIDGGDDTAGEQLLVRVVARPWGLRRDGRRVLPPGEGAVYFNIVLEPMVYGIPQKMFPVLLSGAAIVLLSLFVIAPIVLSCLQPPAVPTQQQRFHSAPTGEKVE